MCQAWKLNLDLRRNTNSMYFGITRYSFSIDVAKNYYEILGVKKTATTKDIRSAYLKLSKRWHPDSHQTEWDKKYANDKFVEISESYKILYNNDTRKKYNELRRQYESILIKESTQTPSESEWKSYESPNNEKFSSDSWILSKEKKEEYRRRMLAEWDYILEQEAEKEEKARKRPKKHKWSMNL